MTRQHDIRSYFTKRHGQSEQRDIRIPAQNEHVFEDWLCPVDDLKQKTPFDILKSDWSHLNIKSHDIQKYRSLLSTWFAGNYKVEHSLAHHPSPSNVSVSIENVTGLLDVINELRAQLHRVSQEVAALKAARQSEVFGEAFEEIPELPRPIGDLVDANAKLWIAQYPDQHIIVDRATGEVVFSSEDDWAIMRWLKDKSLPERDKYIQLHTSAI
ncbi:hypothetical protein [Burkholderia ubonensis]|uniref:hypothetical protein n=1 Tax=Burkholderia ubonensis TaxID=101571 RepID=UPI0012FCAF7C|nr:hypothetical protein [Burkholderia ubonensis]